MRLREYLYTSTIKHSIYVYYTECFFKNKTLIFVNFINNIFYYAMRNIINEIKKYVSKKLKLTKNKK